jgi:CRP-like cAMP-binding protein
MYSSLWDALLARGTRQQYRKGVLLFEQGVAAEDIFLVENGEVRLTLHSQATSETVFAVAGAGSVLGLSEAITGDIHKLCAVTAQPCQISRIPRPDLLEFLRKHHEFCMHVVRLLSEDLHGLYHCFLTIAPKSRPRKASSNPDNKKKSRP